MMKIPSLLPLFLLYIATAPPLPPSQASSIATHQINRGFIASPDPDSSAAFQPLLTDPTGVFSLGFLRLDPDGLDLAVLHLPSSFPLWRVAPSPPPRWAASTALSFNGSLLLFDPQTGSRWWSTPPTTKSGDRLVLLNSSNLQILNLSEPIWQSFDFPSDTLVQGQNFTETAALISANQRYSMLIAANSLQLRLKFVGGGSSPVYWKHSAMEAKALIVTGGGPVYARVESAGFLAMYQNERAPVDVLPFDTFNRGIPGLRRLTLEPDGNLRGYYWNGSIWARDFVAIAAGTCELPDACGPYGLCRKGEPTCGCLDNETERCLPAGSGDLCGGGGGGKTGYRVLRREGVDLANREYLGFEKMGSLGECEGSCERDCGCWGAVYSNGSGLCYKMDYPIQTVVAVGDERKVGYFKVRIGGGGRGVSGRRAVEAVLVAAAAVTAAGFAGFGGYRYWKRRRDGVAGSTEDGGFAGPYKGLSSSSFGSIELSNSFPESERERERERGSSG